MPRTVLTWHVSLSSPVISRSIQTRGSCNRNLAADPSLIAPPDVGLEVEVNSCTASPTLARAEKELDTELLLDAGCCALCFPMPQAKIGGTKVREKRQNVEIWPRAMANIKMNTLPRDGRLAHPHLSGLLGVLLGSRGGAVSAFIIPSQNINEFILAPEAPQDGLLTGLTTNYCLDQAEKVRIVNPAAG